MKSNYTHMHTIDFMVCAWGFMQATDSCKCSNYHFNSKLVIYNYITLPVNYTYNSLRRKNMVL